MPLALSNLEGFYSERHTDGSNAFIYSRFLVPYLADFKGPALFLDGDMIVKDDVAKLFALGEVGKDVMVVKHDYKTKHAVKYLGNKNEDYPKKNWSSVMLFPNCSNFPCQKLTPRFVQDQTGKFLHRFEWTTEARVGELPKEWNWLVGEYEHNDSAKLLHYTVGIPAFSGYRQCDHASAWWAEFHRMTEVDEVENTPRTKALIY